MRLRPSFLIPPVLAVLLLATAGCRGKQKARTAADLGPSTEAMAVTDPTPAPAALPEPEAEPAAADPLDGADLALINQYAFSQGLLADVFFDLDQADLSESARSQLSRGATFLREHPRFSLVLEGHCDERGTSEYNLALGERRAAAARSYLTDLGVAAQRLGTVSYGKERPLCQEADESCWQQNRRAHPLVTAQSSQ